MKGYRSWKEERGVKRLVRKRNDERRMEGRAEREEKVE